MLKEKLVVAIEIKESTEQVEKNKRTIHLNHMTKLKGKYLSVCLDFFVLICTCGNVPFGRMVM